MVRFADRFVLEREIGSGGMSRVFLGRDEVLDRPVAIKVLKPGYGGTDIGARFRREGRTAASLSHPNIVQVYDAGEDEFEGREASYIVMEYLSGGDLKDLIDGRGTLSGAELSRLSGVAAGLAHAHGRGVIHRDIKPHNVLLDEHGSPKLADFGIARALDATHATRTGSYLGTALYSSPEQLHGGKVTPKSDVYSLGVTLYHAAVGEPPFNGAPIEVASQHISREPTPPRALNDAMSPALEALILDCMQKDPDARPDADDVRLGLLEAGQGVYPTQSYDEPPAKEKTEAGKAPPPPPRTGQNKPPGGAGSERGGERRRGLLAVLALVAVLAVIGLFAASALLGDGGETGGGSNPSADGGAAKKENAQGQGGGGGGQATTPATQTATQTASASSQGAGSSGDGEQASGGPTAEDAERTVEEFYISTSEGEYDRSARLLSEAWRRSTFPDRATFERTFAKVERVEFVEGPNAEVSGDEATVTGVTQATLTDQVERNKGTWNLIKVEGEWKIDSWTVTNLSTRPA